MKRFFGTVIVAILLLVSVPASSVAAAEPSETPTTSPTPIRYVTPVPSGKPIDVGAINSLITNDHSYSFGKDQTETSVTIPNVNLEANSDFKVADLDSIAAMFSNASPFLTPLSIKQQTIEQEPNLYISGRARYCKYQNGEIVKEKVSARPYKTEILPELSTLDQASRQIAPMLTRYSISKTDDSYDFTRDPQEIEKAPLCDADGTGDMQKEKTVLTAEGFSVDGWIISLIKNIFTGDSGSIKSTLSSGQLTPYTENMNCLIVGCDGSEDLSYLQEGEQEKVKKGGGIAKTYAPISHDITEGEKDGAQQNTFGGGTIIETHTAYTKAMEKATNYIKCAILPRQAQAKYGLTGECQRKTETTCSTGSLPAFSIKSECKLKSTSINGYTLSTKLVETIEGAASAYDVPAALMLGVMFGEGAFNGNKVFSSSAVDTYLDGCSLLPECDINSTKEYKNIVPFAPSSWADVKDAVKIIDPNRTSNPCNLTDGIFAVAENLHRFQFSPQYAGKTCFGINLVSSGAGVARTCSTWNDKNAESAIRFWELGGTWNDTTRSCATKRNSCLIGGKIGGLQCETGGDTCDTIQNPYAEPSHNACVYNVYKNH